MQCFYCQFFEINQWTNPDPKKANSACLRYPPVGLRVKTQYSEEVQWQNPIVCGTHWCGEFKLRNAKPQNSEEL